MCISGNSNRSNFSGARSNEGVLEQLDGTQPKLCKLSFLVFSFPDVSLLFENEEDIVAAFRLVSDENCFSKNETPASFNLTKLRGNIPVLAALSLPSAQFESIRPISSITLP